MLDRGVGNGVFQRWRRDRGGSLELAMLDGELGHAVLGHLIEQGAGNNELEEFIKALRYSGERLRIPGRAPEDGEDFDGAKKRPAPVGQLWGRTRGHSWSGFE
jgi:hypothetical protein